MFHKASKWYELCPWINNNGCKHLRMIWKKDLGCTFHEETQVGILSNNGKYIREARGKCIQYKILHRYYYTATRLNNMGLIKDWKCKTEHSTYMNTLWECPTVFPL